MKMIKSNRDYPSQETIQKYASAIRHFRGYLDKEKFEDDFRFLMDFVQDVYDETTSIESSHLSHHQSVG